MQRIETKGFEQAPHKGREIVTLCDLARFADLADGVSKENGSRKECRESNSWTGKQSFEDCVSYTRKGDLSHVEKSDKLLARFESLAPMRGAWARMAHVTGSSPIVTNAIIGHPLSMRRRVRIASESAPLSIVVDLVSSGAFEAEILRKRGAIILALVRALSALRPVELIVGGAALAADVKDNDHAASHVWMKLDTSPLDLARAAHVFGSPAFARGLLYSVISEQVKSDGGFLRWPYGDYNFWRKNMRPVLSRFLGNDDMLCVAAPHSSDGLMKNPEAWFDDTLKQYGGVDAD